MKIRGKIGETFFSASIKVQDEKEISSRNGLREGDKSHCISLLRHHRPTGPLKIVPDNWPPFLFEWHLYPSRLPAVEWSQCRKSHDHRRKITRNPVCWKIQVLLPFRKTNCSNI